MIHTHTHTHPYLYNFGIKWGWVRFNVQFYQEHNFSWCQTLFWGWWNCYLDSYEGREWEIELTLDIHWVALSTVTCCWNQGWVWTKLSWAQTQTRVWLSLAQIWNDKLKFEPAWMVNYDAGENEKSSEKKPKRKNHWKRRISSEDLLASLWTWMELPSWSFSLSLTSCHWGDLQSSNWL